MAELSAGEIGSTAISGTQRRPVTFCGRWSCSVLHWAGYSAEGTAIWQQLKARRNCRVMPSHLASLPSPKDTSLSSIFLQRFSLWDKLLKVLLRKVLHISSSKFLKLEKERCAPPLGSGAPLASLSVIGLEEEEFRRSRWLCRAQRGSLTSLPVVI